MTRTTIKAAKAARNAWKAVVHALKRDDADFAALAVRCATTAGFRVQELVPGTCAPVVNTFHPPPSKPANAPHGAPADEWPVYPGHVVPGTTTDSKPDLLKSALRAAKVIQNASAGKRLKPLTPIAPEPETLRDALKAMGRSARASSKMLEPEAHKRADAHLDAVELLSVCHVLDDLAEACKIAAKAEKKR